MERQDLPCKHLTQHELDSVIITVPVQVLPASEDQSEVTHLFSDSSAN